MLMGFLRMGSLATLDLNNTGISLLPSSLSFLVNLKTLYLGRCKFNQSTDISVIGMLKKLEILSLTNCGLDGLPEEIRELTNLRLLNLEGNGTNNFNIPKNVISSMSCLEYLNTSHCNIKWEIEGLENGNNVALAEVSSRPCLSYLTLELYDHGNVNRFVITFSDEANIMCLNSRSSISPTKCSFNVSSVPVCHSIKVLIQRVESLELTECIGLKSVEQLGAGFNNLKELKVKECSELEYVMSVAEAGIEEARVSDVKFSRLREMSSLENIWKGSIPFGCFENLEKTTVSDCPKLRYLFSTSMARNLQNLKILYIWRCDNMVELIASSKREMVYHDNVDDQQLLKTFPSLKQLSITSCENLKQLWDTGKNSEKKEDDDDQLVTRRTISILDFPCLEYLEILGCKKLKRIHLAHQCTEQLEKIQGDSEEWFEGLEWENPNDKLHMRALFDEYNKYKARSLDINSAHYMVSVFNVKLVKRVPVDLKSIDVFDCGGLRDVFNLEEIGTASTLNIEEALSDFTFSELREMYLRNLPMLENIWKGYIPSVGCFENLKIIDVCGCHKLSYLFSLSMARNLQNLEYLCIYGCSGMVKLITSDEDEDPMTSFKIFPKLETLIIVCCQNLKQLWDDKLVTGRTISILDFPYLDHLRVVQCDNLKRIHLTHQCTQQLKDIIGTSEEWFDEGLEWENPNDKLLMRPLFKEEKSLHIISTIFNLNLVKRVPDFDSLYLTDCVGLKNVFSLEEVGTSNLDIEVAFSKLRVISFSNLPILENIWKGYFPCFENLEVMNVYKCEKLRYLFSLSMATTLRNLKKLEINQCSSMVKLIASERLMVDYHGDNVDDQLLLLKILPNLKRLVIKYCENLKQLWDGKNYLEENDDDSADDDAMTGRSSILDFPDLEIFKVLGCKKLKRIHLTHQCTEHLEKIVGDSEEWFEGLEWENPNDKSHMQPLFKVRS